MSDSELIIRLLKEVERRTRENRILRQTLQGIAASIDRTADAHDQIKTAYWFIRNPQDSPWVKTQIQRAADNAKRIQVNSLYPRTLPRASFLAVGLILLLGILNFLPV